MDKPCAFPGIVYPETLRSVAHVEENPSSLHTGYLAAHPQQFTPAPMKTRIACASLCLTTTFSLVAGSPVAWSQTNVEKVQMDPVPTGRFGGFGFSVAVSGNRVLSTAQGRTTHTLVSPMEWGRASST